MKNMFLLDKYGNVKFGGGEQFLRDMAKCYKKLKYKVYFVGYDKSLKIGKVKQEDDFSYFNVNDKATLIKAVDKYKPKIIHILSGTPIEVIEIAKQRRARIVYGIHFWRDMWDVNKEGYQNIEVRTHFEPYFYNVLNNADYIYANSEFSQEICERGYNTVLPIIYSIPYEKKIIKTPITKRNKVLLINTHPLKGSNDFLKFALMIPELEFVGVCNQGKIDEMKEIAKSNNINNNITILPYEKNLNKLYKGVKFLLCRSIESFGRVVVEAQRRGIPVIGINKGNMKYILKDSGIILPHETENRIDVVKEIKRVNGDIEEYKRLSKLAEENAKKYDFKQQYTKVKDLIRCMKTKILICVGSGIGNMIQATAMVRKIAEFYDTKVDIYINNVTCEYSPSAKIVWKNDKYVNMITTDRTLTSSRIYDIVFVAGCWGKNNGIYKSRRVVVPQSVGYLFSDYCKTTHEAIYNMTTLRCLDKEFEKIKEISIDDFFVGDYKYIPPNNKRKIIGIHNGRYKTYLWKGKEYNNFEDVVKLLKDKFEFWSFGGTKEFVRYTTDKTGTSMKDTIENMMKCDFFLTTDSGLMHIADILKIPQLVLFGESSISKNGPLSPTSHILVKKLPCVPCQYKRNQIECKDYKCMKFAPKDVADEINKVIQ